MKIRVNLRSFNIQVMTEPAKQIFPKNEHLSSLLLIGKLFAGGSKSLAVFPLRAVYMPVEKAELPAVSVLISVSKKRFKRAVKRNRVKRQIREAYRKHKSVLIDALEAKGEKLAVAFIWLDDELHASSEIEEKVKKLLQLVAERIG